MQPTRCLTATRRGVSLRRPRPTVAQALIVIVALTTWSPGPTAAASTVPELHVVAAGLSTPTDLAAGPDGLMWVTSPGNHTIGRFDTTGVYASVTDDAIGSPTAITAAPDGAMWFINADPDAPGLGRLTVDGRLRSLRFPEMVAPADVVAGRDGVLWVSDPEADALFRITTEGVLETVEHPNIDRPGALAVGPDGSLWFINAGGTQIAHRTPGGDVEVWSPSGLQTGTSITVTAANEVWFTEPGTFDPFEPSQPGWVGRLHPDGTVDQFLSGFPNDIIEGPDGRMWVSFGAYGGLVALDASGQAATVDDARAVRVAVGGDGNVWFIRERTHVGRADPATMSFDRMQDLDCPSAVTVTADGALWYTDPHIDAVGRLQRSQPLDHLTMDGLDRVKGITTGPDGAVWLPRSNTERPWDPDVITRLDTAGTTTDLTDPRLVQVEDLVTGADGRLWFDMPNAIGSVTIDGQFRFVDADVPDVFELAPAPDGSIWFVDFEDAIGRLSGDGPIEWFTDPAVAPNNVTAASNGNMWFSDRTAGTVGQITPAGEMQVLADGLPSPQRLAELPDGSLWFTAWVDGGSAIGWLLPSGERGVLADRLAPFTDLVAGTGGNLYGTNCGARTVACVQVSPTPCLTQAWVLSVEVSTPPPTDAPTARAAAVVATPAFTG